MRESRSEFREVVSREEHKLTTSRYHDLTSEDGFTLPELLVTMMVMLIVMFAIYSVFDMSIRVFMLGNDKVEAVENARLGLEKMERDIRAAHPYNSSDDSVDNDHLFFDTGSPGTGAMPSEARITLGNDLSSIGDGKVECPNPEGRCEYITYKLTAANSSRTCTETNAPCVLRRVNTRDSANAGDPVVEFVQPGGLTFTYFESDGTSPEDESEITRVQVRLRIEVDGHVQSLTTSVDLRNRTGP